MDRIDLISDLVLRMEDICAMGELPRFDRVQLKTNPDELWFLWEETKQIVIVEMPSGPDQIAEAVARAMAGDPVLN